MDFNINSIRSVFIETLFINDSDSPINCSTATGFIIEKKNHIFLITNKHVVSGCHNFTGKNLDKNGCRPNYLRITIHFELKDDNIYGGIIPKEFMLKLYDDDVVSLSNKKWLEYDGYGQLVDIAVIDITYNFKSWTGVPFEYNNKEYLPILSAYSEESNVLKNFKFKVTDDVFIIGFPYSYDSTSGSDYFAIWSKGSIASEFCRNLNVPIDAHFKDETYYKIPAFLIDARTREGQSGSPVIAQINNNTMLLGIYSGRTCKDSDLGYVWKIELVLEIIDKYLGEIQKT